MSGSGNSWVVWKSAPHSRQIAIPAPHHSVFLQAGCPSWRPTNSVKAQNGTQYWHPEATSTMPYSKWSRQYWLQARQVWAASPSITPKLSFPWGTWARSAGPFSQDSCLSSTDTQTDRPCYLCNKNTHTCLTALCPGLHGWAREVKPIWILLKQQTVSGSGISWAVCKSAPRSSQVTMPVPHHSVFYRPDALPAAQPTASKHWRQLV